MSLLAVALALALAPAAPCAKGGTKPPGKERVSLHLLVGRGVPRDASTRIVREIQQFWSAYGYEVGLGGVEEIEPRPLVRATNADVDEAMRTARLDPSVRYAHSDAAKARKVALETSLAPLAAFLKAHASEPEDTIAVVVLPRLATPDAALSRVLTELDGLTLSPALARTDEGRELFRDLQDALGLASFRPTVFLSWDALERGARTHVAAHEIGHALGLGHRPERWNLMSPERMAGCSPVVDDAQLRTLRKPPRR